ncbi:Uncharacterized protein TCM_032303 [Theobroma cacao]|uniref:CCHC-type domain-containing protein n=1 Tax=Theobroma cacao TaxID=3641 RepID=A0A061F9J3_THECC|nr:Uncharacterized protein TCM_032303 [Theobroma cacao]
MTSVIVEWIKESALHLFATSALCYLSCAIVGLACLTTGGLPPTFTTFKRSKALKGDQNVDNNGVRDGGLAILVGATTIATTTNIIAIEGGFSDSGASGSDGGGGSSGESGAGGGCGDSRDIEQMTLKELVNALEGLEQKKAVREQGLIESALIAKSKNLKFGSSNSRSNDVDKKNKGHVKKVCKNKGKSVDKKAVVVEELQAEDELVDDDFELVFKDKACTVIDFTNEELWHRRYGHANYSSLKLMLGKQKCVPFPKNKSWNATQKLQLLHTDLEDENVDEPPVRGTRSLQDIYSRCYVFVIEPSSFAEVAVDEKWKQVMEVEMSMIRKNQTWILVKKPDKQKVIGVKWVYRTKLNSDGFVNKYKARLVVKGFSQVYGVDYLKTFAPVARHDTIKLLVGLAAKEGWLIWHFDIQSAFLNGTISEAFMLNSQKALLNQERKIWYASSQRHYMDSNKPQGLDDFLIIGPSNEYLDEFKTKMKNEFDMSDLEVMPYFLRLQIIQNLDFIFLHQKKYTRELLKKFRMDECKVVSTPLVAGSKLLKIMEPSLSIYASSFEYTLDYSKENTESSAEAEYISAAAATNKPLWIKKNMEELNTYESNFMPSGKLLRIKKFRQGMKKSSAGKEDKTEDKKKTHRFTDSNQSGSQRSQTSSELLPVGDPQFPYYLHHIDHLGSVVINPKLTTNNYVAWSRSFLLALSIRNKLGFINGSIPKPQVTDDLYSSWIRCNNLIVAWILDSISPPIASTVFYMDFAMKIWSALKQSYAQPDDTRVCNLQYTIGSSVLKVRSQIILMDPIPTLDKVYSLVLREESQRNMLFQTQPVLESSTMNTMTDMKKNSKKDLFCNHCGKKGHSKEKCYRIIGFSEDFKFTKGRNNMRKGKGAVNSVTIVSEVLIEETHMDQGEGLSGTSTMSQMSNLQNQVNKLMEILSENGLTSFEGKSTSTNTQQTKHSLANSAFAGTVKLTLLLTLKNVLCVPSFKFKLVSTGQLTSTKTTCVLFTDMYCIVQDIPSWTVIGVARAITRLYLMEDKK